MLKGVVGNGIVRMSNLMGLTISSVTSMDPVITSSLADGEFTWTDSVGNATNVKAPAQAFFNTGGAGDYSIECSDWTKVTGIDFNTDNVTSLRIAHLKTVLANLTSLIIYANAGLADDISSFPMNTAMTFWATSCVALTGSVDSSTFTPPKTLIITNATELTGDIGGWTFHASQSRISIPGCTGLEGDMSLWDLSSTSLSKIDVGSVPVTYGVGGAFASVTRNSSDYDLDDCGMTSGEVDAILADCVTAGTTNSTLDLTDNAIPSATGLLSKDTLDGDGWTVEVDS